MDKKFEDKFEELWESEEHFDEEINSELIYKKIQEEIKSSETDGLSENLMVKYRYWIAAASIVIFCIAGFWLSKIYIFGGANNNLLTAIKTSDKAETIILSDNSIINLSEYSSLEYPKIFDEDIRKVKLLSGKAYFDIVHLEDKSFQVDVGNLLVKVLGTSFEINYSENQIGINVEKGRIRIESLNSSKFVELAAKEKFIYQKQNEVFQKITTPHSNETSPPASLEATLSIKFSNQSLDQILTELEKKTKLKFELSSNMKSRILFTNEYNNVKISSILEDISKIYNVRLVQIGKDRVQLLKKE